MNILYISNKPIYPLIDGGCIAMNQFLKCLLKAGYNVKHFTVSTHKHTYSETEYPIALNSIIHTESSFIDTRINPFSALAYIFKKGSYNIDRFKSSRFRSKLKSHLKNNKVDIVIFESIYLASYFSVVKKYSTAKTIIRSHNVEYEIWERLAENEAFFLKKIYFKKLAKDLKKAELSIINKTDGIISITFEDEKKLLKYGVKIPLTTIPVSIESQSLNCDYLVNSFFHIGSMNWLPNLEAVNNLINNIFPKIRLKIPTAKLYLGGSFMPDTIQTSESEGIIVEGFINNVPNFITSNGIMLAPIKSGSGVRVKILESMSFGVPIVTTKIGIEGIHSTNGTDIMIANTEDEFIQNAIELSLSKEIRESIGRNAKKNIEENYQTEVITKKLIEFIKKIS